MDPTPKSEVSSTSIDNLSDDILLSIFCQFPVPTWWAFWYAFSITHVCSRWRVLAVEHCPALWRRYAFLHRPPREQEQDRGDERRRMAPEPTSEFNKELLRRCHGVNLLDVGWDTFPDVPLTAAHIADIIQESPRIESFRLTLGTPNEWIFPSPPPAVLNALANAAFPSLQHLSMAFASPRECFLPAPVVRGDLSSLRSLTLFTTWLDLGQHNIGDNLTDLTVSMNFAKDPRVPANFSAYLPILQTLPNLVELCLEVAQRPDQEDLPRLAPRHITLEHLTVVILDFTNTDLALFVQYVTLPACRTLRLIVRVTASDDIHTHTETVVRRYAGLQQQGQGNPELTVFTSTDPTAFGCGFLRSAPPPGPCDDERSLISVPWCKHADLAIQLLRYGTRVPDEGLEDTFRLFLSAWNFIIKELTTLVVPGPVEGSGSMPDDFLRPLAQTIGVGCAEGGHLRRLLCMEQYVDALVGPVGENGGGMRSSPAYPLEVIPIPAVVASRT
ncbi:hypothetical protein NMY22_g16864 [Coprinellus aureogranulatus]|nr:hypothetical protein NMY22_g16864 [Coprinellus aureogranulatus]